MFSLSWRDWLHALCVIEYGMRQLHTLNVQDMTVERSMQNGTLGQYCDKRLCFGVFT